MPKCEPLGSPEMKAAANAKEAGRAAVLKPETMARRMKALQDLCGYARRESFAVAMDIDPRRMKYIIDNPEACKLSEAAAIQTMAMQFGMKVFDMEIAVLR